MMPEIRFLDYDKVSAMESLAQEFYDQGFLPGEFNWPVFRTNWDCWLRSGAGIVIGAWDGDHLMGAIGGLFSEGFSTGELELSELFWFMGQDARGQGLGQQLLDEFIEAGRRAQARRVYMINLSDGSQSALDQFYRSKGFEPMEKRHVLELEN